MVVLVGLLAGIASSAVFFLVQKYLIEWPYPWDLISTAAVFAASTALAFFFQGKVSGKKNKAAAILSNNKVKGDMKANIEGLDISQPAASILSGNAIGGNADIQVKDSKL